jgi:pyruvate-formate lyase-activating enzyme
VRLNRACNNRCVFCHDCLCHDGVQLPFEQLAQELRQGIAEGAERLILSGGEPTIHPRFLELVALGRELGFGWIQTVSNGRMFAYPGFAARAAQNGLREATFSLHGHTPELHDRLTGVADSFRQALTGLRNLQAAGLVVNIDVVISALNASQLPELVEFYLSLGIREFDLLGLVPFGRAWQGREELFIPAERLAPPLRAAIMRARAAGAVVWTNRLPAAALEGLEDLVQDPHKLHDEVRGRRAELEDWIAGRAPMACREPERCAACFMRGVCAELERWSAALQAGRLPGLRVTWAQRDRPVVRRWAARADWLRFTAPDPGSALGWVRGLEAPPRAWILELDRALAPGSFQDWPVEIPRPVRLASAHPDALESLLRTWPGGLEVVLDRASAAWLAERAGEVRALGRRLAVSLRRFGTLTELAREGCDPFEALGPLGQGPWRLAGLPLCACPGSQPLGEPALLAPEALGEAGLDLVGMTEYFIREIYGLHAGRCAGCSLRASCPGMPVQHARRFGLDGLRPAADLTGPKTRP